MMNAFSDFGAQLDSFADAITFGVAPAMVAKVLLEREGVLHPRIHFLAAGVYALMAVLRLARFNLEADNEKPSHDEFRGLPSPAAAASVIVVVLLYLSLLGTIEVEVGQPTPVGRGVEFLPDAWRAFLIDALPATLLFVLPCLGLLMVSNVRYPHAAAMLLSGSTAFPMLVRIVLFTFALYLAPVPVLSLAVAGYVGHGLVRQLGRRRGGGGRGGVEEAA
jgi:CDP-diacylglycerol--serine O-phosphatidyltransferase